MFSINKARFFIKNDYLVSPLEDLIKASEDTKSKSKLSRKEQARILKSSWALVKAIREK